MAVAQRLPHLAEPASEHAIKARTASLSRPLLTWCKHDTLFPLSQHRRHALLDLATSVVRDTPTTSRLYDGLELAILPAANSTPQRSLSTP